jgi:hypothetical protein
MLLSYSNMDTQQLLLTSDLLNKMLTSNECQSIHLVQIQKILQNYGKFEYQDISTMPHRDNPYNYQQFVVPEWRDFCDLTNRPGGLRSLK